MPQIIVKQDFSFWHRGYERRDYAPGAEPVDTTDECATVAICEGWACEPGAEHKAATKAPENKDAAPKRRIKSAA